MPHVTQRAGNNIVVNQDALYNPGECVTGRRRSGSDWGLLVDFAGDGAGIHATRAGGVIRAVGFAGEEAMREIMEKFGLSFEHNQQSERIVRILEQAYPQFTGLNLSNEVIEGLMKHQTPWDQTEPQATTLRPSLEAEVVL